MHAGRMGPPGRKRARGPTREAEGGSRLQRLAAPDEATKAKGSDLQPADRHGQSWASRPVGRGLAGPHSGPRPAHQRDASRASHPPGCAALRWPEGAWRNGGENSLKRVQKFRFRCSHNNSVLVCPPGREMKFYGRSITFQEPLASVAAAEPIRRGSGGGRAGTACERFWTPGPLRPALPFCSCFHNHYLPDR